MYPLIPVSRLCEVNFFPAFNLPCQLLQEPYHLGSVNNIMINQDCHIQDIPYFDPVITAGLSHEEFRFSHVNLKEKISQ